MKRKFAKLTRFISLALALLMLLGTFVSCGQPTDDVHQVENSDKNDVLDDKQSGSSEGDDQSDNTADPDIDTSGATTYNILSIGTINDGLAAVYVKTVEKVKTANGEEEKHSNGMGFIDTKGNLKIAPKYESADAFSNGLARVKLNGKYGYINTKGDLVVDTVYDKADEYFDTLALVEKNKIKQYVNASGKAVYTATGKEVAIGEYCNGFFWVETVEELISGNVNTVTYYNEKGEAKFSVKAENAEEMSSFNEFGYAILKIKKEGRDSYYAKDYVMIDKTGSVVDWVFDGVKSSYTTLRPESLNYYFYTSEWDGSYGGCYYVDFETKKVYETETIYNLYLGKNYYFTPYGWEYDSSMYGKGSNVILCDDKIFLHLDSITEFGGAGILGVSYCLYNNTDCFLVCLSNDSGVRFTSLIDASGKIIISPTKEYTTFYVTGMFSDIYRSYNLSAGLFKAQDTESKLFGFIDMNGNWSVQPKYNSVTDFYGEGDSAVAVADENTIINRKGEVVFTIATAN